MIVYLKQVHPVSFLSIPICALYCRCVVHEILEFLATPFHCHQKHQLEFIGICLNLVLFLSLNYSVIMMVSVVLFCFLNSC